LPRVPGVPYYFENISFRQLQPCNLLEESCVSKTVSCRWGTFSKSHCVIPEGDVLGTIFCQWLCPRIGHTSICSTIDKNNHNK
jgi:hypothetical protein